MSSILSEIDQIQWRINVKLESDESSAAEETMVKGAGSC